MANQFKIPRRLKKRAIAIAINGNVRLPVLAKTLEVPLPKLTRWKHRFQDQVQGGQWPAKKTKNHLARLQSRISNLKAARQTVPGGIRAGNAMRVGAAGKANKRLARMQSQIKRLKAVRERISGRTGTGKIVRDLSVATVNKRLARLQVRVRKLRAAM
jgi:uncharacterized small protein (DUF1192 family)